VDAPPLEDAPAAGGRLSVERVVVRAPNWVGDAVLSLGAVRDVRRNFPAARLEVLARPWVAPLYAAVAEVDAVRESHGLTPDRRLLRGAFDAAVLLPNSFASAAPPWAAGIPERWGYATDGRGPLLTRKARVPPQVRGRSQVYYYRAMLAGIGLTVSATPDVRLRPLEAWSARAASLLGDEGPWIGLNPGAFFGSAKRWEAARYAAAGERLARDAGARIAILGGTLERPLGEAIAAALDAPARVLCGETSLGDLVGVLARLRLLLTNDSGPMHLAAALGVPVVAVFGPTDWRETAPVGERNRLVREPVPCSPCLLRECPIDHRCMRRVGVERVVSEARALLAEA
jgi:heptosyltransferase-2